MYSYSPIRVELAHILVTCMTNISSSVCNSTYKDELVTYLLLFWYNLLVQTDLQGDQGLVAVTFFQENTLVAIIEYILQFIWKKKEGGVDKVWSQVIRLLMLL